MSQSLQDLAAAFAGESQARNKYMAFAKKAEADGYSQLARLFRAAAQAEFVHAQNHFKAMGEILSSAENLQAAIAGENYEVVSMYPPFIANAQAEGNRKAETSFKWAYEVEQTHEALYREAAAGLEQTRDEDFDYYVCPVCGHTHKRSAPDQCPVCGTPGSRFELIH
jgi:rubrerythrin